MTKEAVVPEGVPRVTIVLGGQPRVLVFTLGTAIRLQRLMGGDDADEAFSRLMKGAATLEDIPILLCAMLAHDDDRDLTPEEVSDMIPLRGPDLDRIKDAIAAVVAASDLAEDDKAAEGEPPARRTTPKKKKASKK